MTAHAVLHHLAAALANTPSVQIRHGLLGSAVVLQAAAVWLFVPSTGVWPVIVCGVLFTVLLVLAGWYWSPAQRRRRATADGEFRAELRALALSLDQETESTNGARR